mmetsp:Transcript_34343/g.70134  ORF Transcript_34343/g.70134 Transcript_34343/m.70134 type:complete len:82 (-) Transcript_34343:130-375(-)
MACEFNDVADVGAAEPTEKAGRVPTVAREKEAAGAGARAARARTTEAWTRTIMVCWLRIRVECEVKQVRSGWSECVRMGQR